MLDLGLYVLYALLIIALASAVVFSIVNAMKEPKVLIKSAIGIGIAIVIFGICYAVADSKVSLKAAALGITESSSKLIGAGLNVFFVALAGAFVALLYSEISKALK